MKITDLFIKSQVSSMPEELKRPQDRYTFKQWQTEARIKALTAIVKFLLVILLALISFNVCRLCS